MRRPRALSVVFGQLVFACLLFPGASEAQGQKPETVRLSMAAFAAIYYPHLLAKELGYYAEEGIHIEPILMPGGIATPALLSGDIHFSTSSGSAMTAILRGFDLRVVFAAMDRPFYTLFTHSKDIRKAVDLKGKKIALQSRGDSTQISMTLWLKKHGVDPRDVTWLVVPSQDGRVAALLRGHVDVITSTPRSTIALKAAQHQIYEIAYLGREVKMHFTGLAAAKKLLDTKADMIRRFLRATAKGREFFRTYKEDTLRLTRKYDKTGDEVRTHEYDATLETMTLDGTEGLEAQKTNIEAVAQVLGTATLPADRVFDFRLTQEAYKDLKDKNWRPAQPGDGAK
jgi:NitT/TauT family transport system substrate-binding protein